MNRWLGFGLLMAGFVTGGVVLASTPFGGDDTGTIPPDSPKGPITKCENAVGKAVGTLVKSIGKCTASRASGKLKDDTAEDACEQKALTKFGTTKTKGCSGCTDLSTLGPAVEALLDTNNNQVYCTATGTPFGGDDSGMIPSDSPKGPITKCENGVNKAAGTLVGAIVKCHASRASGKLADDTAEDACEQKGLTKFGKTKVTGCDSCTDLSMLGSFVEGQADGANALVYCASPSEAFLDAPG